MKQPKLIDSAWILAPPEEPKAPNDKAQLIYNYLTDAVNAEHDGLTRYHRESLESQIEQSLLDVNVRMALATEIASK